MSRIVTDVSRRAFLAALAVSGAADAAMTPPRVAASGRVAATSRVTAANRAIVSGRTDGSWTPAVATNAGTPSCWFRGANASTPTSWPNSGSGLSVSSSQGAPAYHATGGPNNLPYVSFNGTNDYLLTGSFGMGGLPITVVVVAKFVGNGSLLDDRNSGNCLRIYRDGSGIHGHNGTVEPTTTATTETAWHHWMFEIATGSDKLSCDGILKATSAPASNVTPSGLIIGTGNPTLTDYGNCQIAELLIWGGAAFVAADYRNLNRWMYTTFLLGTG